MASNIQAPPAEEANHGKEHKPLFDLARRVLLAGIGAMALAQDEVEEFVNKLVERGEIAEKDGKQLLRELLERRKLRAGEVENQFSKRVAEILDRMNVPTRSDIEALGDKIAALSQKLDELKKTRS